MLTDKTTFSRNKQKVDGTDVKAGVRVVVDVVGEKDMTAKAVTLSRAGPGRRAKISRVAVASRL